MIILKKNDVVYHFLHKKLYVEKVDNGKIYFENLKKVSYNVNKDIDNLIFVDKGKMFEKYSKISSNSKKDLIACYNDAYNDHYKTRCIIKIIKGIVEKNLKIFFNCLLEFLEYVNNINNNTYISDECLIFFIKQNRLDVILVMIEKIYYNINSNFVNKLLNAYKNVNLEISNKILLLKIYKELCLLNKKLECTLKETIIERIELILYSFGNYCNVSNLNNNVIRKSLQELIYSKGVFDRINKLKLCKIYDIYFNTNYLKQLMNKYNGSFLNNCSLKNNTEIYNYLSKRGVKYLVHFTNVKNLNYILEYGILSRKILNILSIKATVNDTRYRENNSEYISLSISFPNYKMFYKIRKENESEVFVVLLINLEILKNREIEIHKDNEANNRINSNVTKNIEDLFYEDENRYSIPNHYTTNPQAEIRVNETIPKKFIETICFNRQEDMIGFKNKFPKVDLELQTNSDFFKYRDDYIYWGKKENNYGNENLF